MNTERSRGFWCTFKLKAPWLRAVFLQVCRDRGLSLVLPNKIKPKSDVFMFLKQVSMVTFMHTKISVFSLEECYLVSKHLLSLPPCLAKPVKQDTSFFSQLSTFAGELSFF